MQYAFHNGAMPTTTVLPAVASGTALKTLLQIALKSGLRAKIIEWGFSANATPSSGASHVPGKVELIETGAVFATVTAHVAADIHKYGNGDSTDPTTAYFTVGTGAGGYTSSAEGTVTASRLFEAQQMPSSGFYSKQFPLGREPQLVGGNALRIRVHFAATVDISCYVIIEI